MRRVLLRSTIQRWSPRPLSVAPFSTAGETASPTAASTTAPSAFYDLVIVGGGMVGASLACKLHSDPMTRRLRVLAVDASKPPPLPSSFPSYYPPLPSSSSSTSSASTSSAAPAGTSSLPPPTLRTVALSAKSVALLRDIGVWDAVSATGRTAPYDRMFVWDSFASPPAQLEWHTRDAATFGEHFADPLGVVVENDVLHAHVHARLLALASSAASSSSLTDPALHVLHSTSVQSIHFPTFSSQPSSATAAATAAAISPRFPRLQLSDGRCVATRLVIGADGQSSTVKQAAGFDAIGWSYNQRAVVATVRLAAPITTAYQRFLPTGPVALLPLYGSFANVVWSTDLVHAKTLAACDDATFLALLHTAFHAPADTFVPPGLRQDPPPTATSSATAASAATATSAGAPSLTAALADTVLGAVADLPARFHALWRQPLPGPLADLLPHLRHPPATPSVLSTSSSSSSSSSPPSGLLAPPPAATAVVGARAGFPLSFSSATQYAKARVCLLGDAAHTIHPMAGQGVNLGFGDAQALAAALRFGVAVGADVGDPHVLRRYDTDQRARNAAAALAVDGIARAFQVQGGPLALARTVGVELLDAVPALKQRAAEAAMGLVQPR